MTLRADYDVHGVTLGVEVAESLGSEALGAIDRRLQTFRSCPATPTDLVVHLGDEPLAPPPGPSRPVYESVAGPVRYHDGEGMLFADHRGGAQLRCQPATGEAQLSCRRSSPDSLWLATHPLLTLALIELLKRHRRYSLHAACVAWAEGGILIAGPSGAGKTTLAVALARSGLAFLADDMVFLAMAPDGVEVLGFADEVDVTAQTMAMFAELVPASRRQLAGGGKWSLRVEDALDTPVAHRCSPRLVVLARVSNQDTSLVRPLAASEALVELAPNVLLTDAPSAQAHLSALAQLVATTPCIRLDTGRHLDGIGDLLARARDQ